MLEERYQRQLTSATMSLLGLFLLLIQRVRAIEVTQVTGQGTAPLPLGDSAGSLVYLPGLGVYFGAALTPDMVSFGKYWVNSLHIVSNTTELLSSYPSPANPSFSNEYNIYYINPERFGLLVVGPEASPRVLAFTDRLKGKINEFTVSILRSTYTIKKSPAISYPNTIYSPFYDAMVLSGGTYVVAAMSSYPNEKGSLVLIDSNKIPSSTVTSNLLLGSINNDYVIASLNSAFIVVSGSGNGPLSGNLVVVLHSSTTMAVVTPLLSAPVSVSQSAPLEMVAKKIVQDHTNPKRTYFLDKLKLVTADLTDQTKLNVLGGVYTDTHRFSNILMVSQHNLLILTIRGMLRERILSDPYTATPIGSNGMILTILDTTPLSSGFSLVSTGFGVNSGNPVFSALGCCQVLGNQINFIAGVEGIDGYSARAFSFLVPSLTPAGGTCPPSQPYTEAGVCVSQCTSGAVPPSNSTQCPGALTSALTAPGSPSVRLARILPSFMQFIRLLNPLVFMASPRLGSIFCIVANSYTKLTLLYRHSFEQTTSIWATLLNQLFIDLPTLLLGDLRTLFFSEKSLADNADNVCREQFDRYCTINVEENFIPTHLLALIDISLYYVLLTLLYLVLRLMKSHKWSAKTMYSMKYLTFYSFFMEGNMEFTFTLMLSLMIPVFNDPLMALLKVIGYPLLLILLTGVALAAWSKKLQPMESEADKLSHSGSPQFNNSSSAKNIGSLMQSQVGFSGEISEEKVNIRADKCSSSGQLPIEGIGKVHRIKNLLMRLSMFLYGRALEILQEVTCPELASGYVKTFLIHDTVYSIINVLLARMFLMQQITWLLAETGIMVMLWRWNPFKDRFLLWRQRVVEAGFTLLTLLMLLTRVLKSSLVFIEAVIFITAALLILIDIILAIYELIGCCIESCRSSKKNKDISEFGKKESCNSLLRGNYEGGSIPTKFVSYQPNDSLKQLVSPRTISNEGAKGLGAIDPNTNRSLNMSLGSKLSREVALTPKNSQWRPRKVGYKKQFVTSPQVDGLTCPVTTTVNNLVDANKDSPFSITPKSDSVKNQRRVHPVGFSDNSVSSNTLGMSPQASP